MHITENPLKVNKYEFIIRINKMILHFKEISKNDINKGAGFGYGHVFCPNIGQMRECRGGW